MGTIDEIQKNWEGIQSTKINEMGDKNQYNGEGFNRQKSIKWGGIKSTKINKMGNKNQ